LSIAAIVFTTLFLIYINRIDLLSKAGIILISIFVISFVLIVNKKIIQSSSMLTIDPKRLLRIVPSRLKKIYAITFITTCIWVLIQQEFDLVFLIFIVALYGITIVHIFSNDENNSRTILFELIITSILFELVRVFGYPYSFPSIDILPHLQWVDAIMITGGNLPYELAGQYTGFYLYQIIIAIAAFITNTGTYVSAYLVTIPTMIIGLVFVYYITYYLTKSHKISQLSALFYILIPFVLYRSVCVMATVPATMAYIILLYLLFQDNEKMPILGRWVLAGVIMIFMTLVHHMTMPLAFVITAILVISIWLYSGKLSKSQKGVLVIFYTIPTVYWIYTYLSSFFGHISSRLFDSISESTGFQSIEISATSNILFSWMALLMSGCMLILLYLAIYHLIATHNINKKIVIILPLITLLLIFFIPGIVDISSMISYQFLVIRWRTILPQFFAIFLAIGCVVLFNLLNVKSKNKYLPLILIIGFCLLCVIASPVYSNAKSNTIFYGTDIYSFSHFDTLDLEMFNVQKLIIPFGSEIYSDHYTNMYYSKNEEMQYINMPYYLRPVGMETLFTKTLFTDNVVASQYPYIIFRHNSYENGELNVRYGAGDGAAHRIIPSDDLSNRFIKNTYNHAKFYENGESSMYVY